MYGASAMAANTMFRSAIVAVFPLSTVQMFTEVHAVFYDMLIFTYQLNVQLSVNWASTLVVACIGIVLLPSPFLIRRKC
jgi:hypothetical protein